MATIETRLRELELRVKALMIWAMVISGIFIFGALASGDEQSRVYITPKIGAPGVKPFVKVVTYDQRYTCPQASIEWGGGFRSVRESDCDPGDLPESYSWERQAPGGYGPGQYEIKIILHQPPAKDLVLKATFIVAE